MFTQRAEGVKQKELISTLHLYLLIEFLTSHSNTALIHFSFFFLEINFAGHPKAFCSPAALDRVASAI